MDYRIQTGALSAGEIAYESKAFDRLLQVFGLNRLPITSAQQEPDGVGSRNFTVTGNAKIFGHEIEGLSLYLDFISGNSFQFQLEAVLPSLTLAELRARGILPASKLSQRPELLDTEFRGVKLVFDSEEEIIYFGLVSSPAQLDFLSSIGLSLDNVGFEFRRSYLKNTAAMYVHADLFIGSMPINTRIEIPLGTELEPGGWVFAIDSTVQLTSGLQAMLNFAQSLGLPSFASLFPDEIHRIPTLFLDDFEMVVDPLEEQLQFLTFRVSSVHKLSLVGEQFAINDIGIRMNVSPHPDSSGISVTLFGTIEISKGVSLNISVLLPENLSEDDWIFAMSGGIDLQSINDISLLPMSTPVGDLKLPKGFLTLKSLRLGTFEVVFNPGHRSLSSIELLVALEADCELIHGLKFSNAMLSLDVSNPFNQPALAARSLTGRAWGTITVGDIPFGVDAEKQDAGWSFTGRTEPGSIPIGSLVSSLAQRFNLTMPDFVSDIRLDDLSLKFSTTPDDSEQVSERVDFDCLGQFPIYHDRTAHLRLSVDVSKAAGDAYSCKLGGQLTIGDLQFTITFSDEHAHNYFIASYSHLGEQKISIGSLVENINAQVARLIPEIDLRDALLAFSKTGSESKSLFVADIGPSINLSHLPLVGGAFIDVEIDDLQFLIASEGLTQSEVTDINNLITADVTRLPKLAQEADADSSGEDGATASDAFARVTIPAGLSVFARMNFGSWSRALNMPVAQGESATEDETDTLPAVNSSSPDGTKWFNLQKYIGPVYLDKVGVQYQNATLWVLLNASLSAAGLTISLDGLSVGSKLSSFSPSFNLHGLGIDFQGGAIEIGAALLRTEKEGEADRYDGMAVIKTPQFALSAFGSYTTIEGNHPSLFIYAFLDYPLGGPAFFYVTGLAAGFGYNRKLITPAIEKVADFPLVQQALGSPHAPPTNCFDTLKALRDDIPPASGEIFLAIGVKFNSFKLIDSFALLTIQFGGHYNVNILGLSKAIVPTPEAGGQSITPLAEVEIAWKAAFDPEEGFLGVDARLTSGSYILSRDCYLTGGYAFYSWFSGEHAGDFVQTLGGYHPRFVVPAHYPVVPRLGFNWRVSDDLTIKGDAYYALTGSALMAGGHLEVVFDKGDLKAWLKVGADFLISWKPYHYDVSIYIDVGVSYTFEIDLLVGSVTVTISVDVGANLHLWGPDFSGTAEIDISVISFTVSFGADASQTPGAIDWNTFQNSFLPTAKKVCSVSVKDGLVRKMEEQSGERWIINPKHFSLLVDSAIPFKSVQHDGKELVQIDANTQFGIGPMDLKSGDLHSTISITIKRDDKHADDEFSYTPIKKRIPAGLWGESLRPDLNSNTFIENVATGFEITPSKEPEPVETARINLSEFKFTPTDFPTPYVWESSAPVAHTPEAESNSLRDSLLKALNVKVDIRVGENVAGDFLSGPMRGPF